MLWLALALSCSGAPAARAVTTASKTSKPATKSTSTRLAEQQRQIEVQRDSIEAQRSLIAEHQALLEAQRAVSDSKSVEIEAQRARLEEMEKRLEEMSKRLEELSSQAGMPALEPNLEKRLAEVEAATKKSPELPPDVVAAGDFPGSIRIPGSDAAIKFGGRIRAAAVFTLDPLGTDDRFLTNSIPVGVVTSGEEKRTSISARASRLNIEFRTPGGREQLRAFFEGDFAGAGNAFRLRHAYAQYIGFIVGQTWSTFSDPAADHLDLDFEGVSSENLIRQPLIRYWWGTEGATRKAVALETPSVSITGGQGVNLMPDAVARGGGGSVSGVVLVPVKRLSDRIVFQMNGGVGIARYINDLNSLGGQDAVFDTTTGALEALPALAWYVSYEHVWKQWETAEQMNLRSMVMWSFVDVDNFDFQPDDAYHKTNRFVLNAVISPSSRVDMGVEYIYGTRANKDGQQGHANQFQLVGLFRF
jgi:TolA-binding protein